jgi:hypothetical protein
MCSENKKEKEGGYSIVQQRGSGVLLISSNFM